MYFRRLYDSSAYLKEHLAVFHAALIDECVSKGGIKMAAPGKYFLPPAELHKRRLNLLSPFAAENFIQICTI